FKDGLYEQYVKEGGEFVPTGETRNIEFGPDGEIAYTNPKDGRTVTDYPDGREKIQIGDAAVTYDNIERLQSINYPDGSCVNIKRPDDGTEIYRTDPKADHPTEEMYKQQEDGSYLKYVKENGKFVPTEETGRIEIGEDAQITYSDSDGQKTITDYPDGQ